MRAFAWYLTFFESATFLSASARDFFIIIEVWRVDSFWSVDPIVYLLFYLFFLFCVFFFEGGPFFAKWKYFCFVISSSSKCFFSPDKKKLIFFFCTTFLTMKILTSTILVSSPPRFFNPTP